jgi:hypothetical protein
MSADDDSTLSDTIIDKLAPTTADGIPLVWSSDNEAHLEGLLFEVGKFYKRKGLFQTFFKNHAAVLSNGKLAVDAFESAYIMSEKTKDSYSFEKPCPPTALRVANYDDATRTVGSPLYGKKVVPTNLTEIPAELKETTVLSVHAVEAEDSRLLTSLTHTFGKSISSDELIDAADGSGYKLLELLRGAGRRRSRGECPLGLLDGFLLGLWAVLVKVLATPDPAAAEGHPLNPRDRLVVGVARDVEGRLPVLVAGLGLVGVRNRLQRGDEGREALRVERGADDAGLADGGQERLENAGVVGGEAEARCRRCGVDLIDLLAASTPAEDGGEQRRRLVEVRRRVGRALELVDLADRRVFDGDEVDHVDLGCVGLAGELRYVALDGLVLLDVVLEGLQLELGAVGNAVADDAGILGGDECFVLGVGVLGAGAPPAGLTSSDALAAITALLSQIVVDGGAGTGPVCRV